MENIWSNRKYVVPSQRFLSGGVGASESTTQ